jgi:hypothetical protein
MNKPKICRIASLHDYDGVIIGRDFAEVFKKGHIYAVSEIMGQIMITDLGEHAKGECYVGAGIEGLFSMGVPFLTAEEYEKQLQSES